MLAAEAALRTVPAMLEEAGHLSASPTRVFVSITLPLIAAAVSASLLIVFVLAISDFAVPGLLRVRVYTTEVFTAFAALYDFQARDGHGAAASGCRCADVHRGSAFHPASRSQAAPIEAGRVGAGTTPRSRLLWCACSSLRLPSLDCRSPKLRSKHEEEAQPTSTPSPSTRFETAPCGLRRARRWLCSLERRWASGAERRCLESLIWRKGCGSLTVRRARDHHWHRHHLALESTGHDANASTRLASIVAKVTRDRLMVRLAARYPDSRGARTADTARLTTCGR